MNDPAPNPRTAEAAATLEQGARASSAYGRDDLADRLTETRRKLLEPTVNVVIVGEFKQGKSSFINALLNSPACPVDDDIATAVPTSVRFGDDREAWALTQPALSVSAVFTDDGSNQPIDPPPAERRPIDFDEIADFATERALDPTIDIQGVEVQLPRRLLAEGLVLVDTPGVGGLGSAHATAALGALSVADAGIFLSDASQEYTRAEMDFLQQALNLCPHVVCVMTKTDFYPSWRRVREINEGHLGRAGYDQHIVPVSSTLRNEALRRDNKQLNVESGFLDVVKLLADEIVGGAADREHARARQDMLAVTDQLASQFDSELSALEDPEASAELTRRLEDAKRQSEQLRGGASKWSTTLNDGVTDLTSDIDHDFRQRVRNVLSEADQAIENSDPLETWAEFEPWLSNRMSFEVVANFKFLTERSTELSRRVAEHFEFAGGDVLEQLDLPNPVGALGRVTLDTGLDLDDPTMMAKGMTVLRGSYSGVLMFTMLGTLIGVALGPIAIGIGLAMGRKGLRDEKNRQLTQRRGQAKTLVRRFSDEVSFQVSKDSRDTLRMTQRQLRDFYSTRAEELHRSTTEALTAANQASQLDERERGGRIRDVKSELERLGKLRTRANELPTAAPSGGGR
jgi:hypothetical protein